VLHRHDGAIRWSYDELWQQSVAVARSLVACGVGKDSRVGILMSNRPEYLAALFGIALAGGTSVALNTFSTAPELQHLVAASGISLLLFEDKVVRKDFAATLLKLEPDLLRASPGAGVPRAELGSGRRAGRVRRALVGGPLAGRSGDLRA